MADELKSLGEQNHPGGINEDFDHYEPDFPPQNDELTQVNVAEVVSLDFLPVKSVQFFHQEGVFLELEIQSVDVNPQFENGFQKTEQVLHFAPLQFFTPDL